MKLKTILLAGAMAIFTLSLAVAKTYDISFAAPTKAGSVQLKSGDYKLTVEGNKVTFTEVKTLQAFTTEGKVENVAKQFDFTRVDTSTDNGNAVIKDIQVGGSKIKIGF